MENKIKVLETTEQTFDRRSGKTRIVKIIEFHNKKFTITFEVSNGSPLGFNYKKCIDILGEDGLWHHVADVKRIYPSLHKDYPEVCNYYNDCLRAGDAFIKKCYKYIKLLY